MKKILILAIAAAMLLSVPSCDNKEPDTKETTVQETVSESVGQTTAAETEEPHKMAVKIELADIENVIHITKVEYNTASQVILSDGTSIATGSKDAGLTPESVKNGTATEAEMAAYANYMANIRLIVRDRLIELYKGDNLFEIEFEDGQSTGFLFLDPVSDGFTDAGDAYMTMMNITDSDVSDEYDFNVPSDVVIISDSSIIYYAKDNAEEPVLLCPTVTENIILSDISSHIYGSN